MVTISRAGSPRDTQPALGSRKEEPIAPLPPRFRGLLEEEQWNRSARSLPCFAVGTALMSLADKRNTRKFLALRYAARQKIGPGTFNTLSGSYRPGASKSESGFGQRAPAFNTLSGSSLVAASCRGY